MRFAARLVVFAAVLGAACGGKAHPAKPAQPSPYEQRYPAVRWVPAGAAYAVVAARTGDLVDGARKLVSGIVLPLGIGPERLELEMRESLGASALSTEDLGAAGVDLEGGAAIFGDPFPTFVVPIADAAALNAFLDEHQPARDLFTTRHREHEVYSWRPGRELEISWVALDGWFLLHIGSPALEAGGGSQAPGAVAEFAWLDAVLDAPERGGLGGEEDLAAAVRAAGRSLGKEEGEMPPLVGLIRIARLGAAALETARRSGAPDELLAPVQGCLGALNAVTGRIYVGGDVSWEGGDAVLAVELTPEAAAAVRDHLAEPAPAGYYAFRAQSGLSFDWRLEVAWLEQLRRRAACPLLSSPIVDPIAAQLGAAPTSYHLAGAGIDPSELEGRIAAYVTLDDPRIVSRQLDRIPGRSWLERKKTIGGVKVRVVGGVPGVPTFAYRLTDRDFAAAVGGGVMQTLWSAGERPASAADEIASFTIDPARLPALEELVEAGLQRVLPWGASEVAKQVAAELRRYRRLQLRLVLEGNSLALHGAMRLAK